MNEVIVHGQQVCSNCIYQSLHYCNKYNEKCVTMYLNGKQEQLCCSKCCAEDGRHPGIPFKPKNNKQKIGYFHMPGPENLDIFASLIIMKQKYPEAFYENREISEIYGAFPGAIWNGRTVNFDGPALSIEIIDNVRQRIESLGLSMNLTWNNHLVNGVDVYDRFCNAITEVFHNGKHSITVASPELFEYLKTNYPNFKYYQSVITTEQDKVFVKKDERFDMYLMNRSLNNNWNELLKIPEEERSKFEFLCNDACTPICYRTGHYDHVNSRLLNRFNEEPDFTKNYCTIDHDFMLYNVNMWPITIKSNDIDKYIENGYIHFKMCSRGDPDAILAYKMAHYLAKPQYHADVFSWAYLNRIKTEYEEKHQ